MLYLLFQRDKEIKCFSTVLTGFNGGVNLDLWILKLLKLEQIPS